MEEMSTGPHGQTASNHGSGSFVSGSGEHPVAPSGESFETDDSPEVPPGRRSDEVAVKKKRGKVPLIIGAAAAVVVVGVVLASTVSSGPDADAAIISAVDSAIGQKTAHATLTGTIQLEGQTATLSGSGSYDFTGNAVQMTMTIGVGGRQESVQLINVGGIVYEALPQIGRLAPGKSWVSVDLSSWLQTAGKSGVGQLGGNPLADLHALAQQGNAVTSLGASTINGQSVQGYAVNLSASVEQRELQQANLPQSMKRLTFGGGSETVYLDGAGNLVRVSMTNSASDGARGTVGIQESCDLSDYGAPVSIVAPPASQVLPFDQYQQLARNSQAT
jgi:hypothetical protein